MRIRVLISYYRRAVVTDTTHDALVAMFVRIEGVRGNDTNLPETEDRSEKVRGSGSTRKALNRSRGHEPPVARDM